MKFISLLFLPALAPGVLLAEEIRQLEAHEHGVGHFDIAFEGRQIAMELRAPGADIVGFEYAAQTSQDRAKLEAAVAALSRPLDFFAPPAAAGCNVVGVDVALHGGEAHEDHGETHAHDEHEESHEHAAHDHDEDQKSDAHHASHTEFHAEYLLECTNVSAMTVIEFSYFEAFENAEKLEVQVISSKGAAASEVLREAPMLDLRGLF
ncbi:hypothetical protein ROLI_015090 [Roseobacter fucihabitans]|uniref:DUF2796 domain-containing protein n=1 Tax=Roseobacter fucihabitans TaxID=1537242 RepID=A0ABZ2BU78_9RHOB|nr:DUF2796 domain-containing protein [Roseobacter litoralis]MBC6965448.1 hypothetical protein [Roseobacter litoralis]